MSGRRWPAYLRTTHGEFHGQTVTSIIRRVYGRRAMLRGFSDLVEPGVGMIVRRAGHGNGWEVLARVHEASSSESRR